MLKNSSINYDILYSIFIFSIGLTLFSALRFESFPLGIGEILLVTISIYTINRNYKDMNISFFKNNLLLKFWLISFLLLLIGSFVSYFVGNILFFKFILHDIFAYIFIFFLLITMHLLQNKTNNFIKIFEKFIYFYLIFYLILFVIFLFKEPSTYIMYNEVFLISSRYLGLSSNPNQLAIFFTIIPFMLIYFYKIFRKNYFFIFTLLCIILSIYIGKRINSEALFLAWFFALIVYIFLIYIEKYNNQKVNMFLFIIAIFLFILFLFNMKEVIFFIDGSGGDYSSASARIELIINAFTNLNTIIYSGFGPGPHSYLNSLSNQFYSEVHNTYLDWFTQTGILGLFLYLYLIYRIMKGLYIKKELILISAFSSLLIFSTFHFIFRQPIFWFFIFFFYIISQGDKKCVA